MASLDEQDGVDLLSFSDEHGTKSPIKSSIVRQMDNDVFHVRNYIDNCLIEIVVYQNGVQLKTINA
jgi:hypothetical protein